MTADRVHPIEARSYQIMNDLVDLSRWPPGARDVVARMVHATADESFAESARIGPGAVEAAVAALRGGAPVVCDARMVVAGVPRVAAAVAVGCWLDAEAPRGQLSLPPPATRSAAAIDTAAATHPDGAIWVVGNAPTALARLLECHRAGLVRPAAIIGLPVGYVGAAEAKDELWASTLAAVSITNSGRRGGSPVAAAALNALGRLAGIV
jgi:precorrin-8X/cobalt-precorrin-8 methylmutase